MRLSAKRGLFWPDCSLGSYLYRLKKKQDPQRKILAMQYAMQALEDMEYVWPETVRWEGDTPVFTLRILEEEQEVAIEL